MNGLAELSWREFRAHPWRTAVIVLAIALGVALGLATHLINQSALEEMGRSVRSVQGEPDVVLRQAGSVEGGAGSGLRDALLHTLQADARVAIASPVLELRAPIKLDTPPASAANPIDLKPRPSIKVLGLDVLSAAALSPALSPTVAPQASNHFQEARFAAFAPNAVFLNASARALLPESARELELQSGLNWRRFAIAGSVAQAGAPLAVIDIAAAQDAFGLASTAFANEPPNGALTRIDLRLASGSDASAFIRELNQGLPIGVVATTPEQQRDGLASWSRAYRVNLTVLALIALFVDAYLVYSVVALSVAKRAPQLALLGVLGMTGRERSRLVIGESAALGVLASALGCALGLALAGLAMRFVGGDLGGGYFQIDQGRLHADPLSLAVYFALGIAAAVVGAWWPARQAAQLVPAAALKGLGQMSASGTLRIAPWLVCWAAAAALSFVPPMAGISLGAYAAMALAIVGTVGLLPQLITVAAGGLRRFATRATALLALERTARVQHAASTAVSGVVASVALGVALTVMVSSFRDSVMRWLDVVLPAPLYVRAAAPTGGETAHLSPELRALIDGMPEVARSAGVRVRNILLDPARPSVGWVAVDVRSGKNAARIQDRIPLIGELLPLPAAAPGERIVAVYVSESMRDLYGDSHGARPGAFFEQNRQHVGVSGALPAAKKVAIDANASFKTRYFVAGVYRDYARQHGAVMLDRADEIAITGDRRINDLMVWPREGRSAAALEAAIKAKLAADLPQATGLIEYASADAIRKISLAIFDRSFAVTVWLQAVAIGIGLFGVAAALSAQVLARRKEFGLLAHLGFTRGQVLSSVTLEGTVWTALGALAGAALGLALGWVLVHVVNPQSFHWTMDMSIPWARLAALVGAVVALSALTAYIAARAAASRQAVLAVKEDW